MKKATEGTVAFSKGVKIYVKAKGFSTKRCLLCCLYYIHTRKKVNNFVQVSILLIFLKGLFV